MANVSTTKIALRFFQNAGGAEPIPDWLKDVDATDRHAVGLDLMRVQWRWPVGMPLCRPMGQGFWEVRTDLPSRCIARVLF